MLPISFVDILWISLCCSAAAVWHQNRRYRSTSRNFGASIFRLSGYVPGQKSFSGSNFCLISKYKIMVIAIFMLKNAIFRQLVFLRGKKNPFIN